MGCLSNLDQLAEFIEALEDRGIEHDVWEDPAGSMAEVRFKSPVLGDTAVYQRVGQNLSYGFRSVDEVVSLMVGPDTDELRFQLERIIREVAEIYELFCDWGGDPPYPPLSVDNICHEIKDGNLGVWCLSTRHDLECALRQIEGAVERLDELLGT